MDAQDLKYHVLLGERDWYDPERTDLIRPQRGAESASALVWDAGRGGLTLRPQFLRASAATLSLGQVLDSRRGAVRDAAGRWYWVAPGGRQILTATDESQTPAPFWPLPDASGPQSPGGFAPRPPEEEPHELRGLGLTSSQFLAAGVVSPPGLLVFDLAAGSPPSLLPLPEGAQPIDITTAPDGGLLLLDGSRCWRFDPDLRLAAGDPDTLEDTAFQPLEEVAAASLVKTRPGPVAPLVTTLADEGLLALDPLPDGTLLVLVAAGAGRPAAVARYRDGERLALAEITLPAVMLDRGTAEQDGPSYLPQAYDLAFSPEFVSGDFMHGTLYIAAADLRDCLAYGCTIGPDRLDITPLQAYLPMVGEAPMGLAHAGGRIHYGSPAGWFALVERPCPRYAPSGTVRIIRLDGRQQGVTWHRLLLDAIIPPGTAVEIATRAGDEPDLPETIPWSPEPEPYLRAGGSELPWHRPFTGEEADLEGAGTWELLFQRSQGRYLQIRLRLRSARGRSPLIRTLRVYYPRYSYLGEYLPQFYQSDESAASFLDRFLANLEGVHTDIERRMLLQHLLIDPRSAPAEYLEWLAGWYGHTLDQNWDEPRRRLFLRHAPALFARRGTLGNLVRLIRLATERHPTDAIFADDPLAYTGLPTTGERPLRSFRIVEGFWAPAVGMQGDPDAEDPLGLFGVLDEGPEPAGPDAALAREYREFLRNWQRVEGEPDEANAAAAALAAAADEYQRRFAPVAQGAHRFTVFVPILVDEEGVRPSLDLDALSAVIRREKPAHTVAEIRPYLPLLRVGEARLGVGTAVGPGSRLVAMVLGSGILGSTYLEVEEPKALRSRLVVGDQSLE